MIGKLSTRTVGMAGLCLAVLGALAVGVTRVIGGSEGASGGDAGLGSVALSVEAVEAFLAGTEESGFVRPSGTWQLALPEDHGGHSLSRAETWVLAAHLEDAEGQPASVQFALSRFGLAPETPDAAAVSWELRSLYHAAVAVWQGGGAEMHAEERFSRGAGAAGQDGEAGEVWLDDWTLSYATEEGARDLTFTARLDSVRVALELTMAKPPEQTADADQPFRGFVVPRLTVSGRIETEDGVTPVSGTAWLDRAWGELPLPGGPLGYDRLQVQLDDGSDLSLVRTRRRDGRGVVTVDGLLFDPAGEAETLSEDVLSMAQHNADATRPALVGFPRVWRVSGPELDLQVEALGPDREVSFVVGGWTVPVRVEGERAGVPVTGLGTLQMTGYETP
ncbi:lipocalin-like domain-containing protein [Jannaschia seohaensis]|uniref:Predicted secreted hydrolase n=1 Tax=Jannaschia seohaensis TaxID=475081 RepID=A0A2Y9ABN8_9RHOB|nr:lipocalin-like domain-containing protein [Jannaschia seohaensis]PWJ21398.1 putative secreted hydrolase [Jannaschia seohaensis]SSA42004.1 Predicted secreted hydrolase [Jannaschia seohaensis]